jgi:hypothetical protein
VPDATFFEPNGNVIEVVVPTGGAPKGFYRVGELP